MIRTLVNIIITGLASAGMCWGQCDYNNPECGPWIEVVIPQNVLLFSPDCRADVYYSYRICNGQLELFVRTIVPNAGCGGIDNPDSFLHHTQRGVFNEMIAQSLVTTLTPTAQIPLCGNGELLRSSVFIASCGIILSCEYELPPNPAPICDPGWNPEPEPHSLGFPPKVKTYRWFPCGTQCCKRSYSLCRTLNDHNQDVVKMTLISKQPVGPDGCSDAMRFSPKPCYSDCQ